jgi:F-type H+-transporting ATPase subunit b
MRAPTASGELPGKAAKVRTCRALLGLALALAWLTGGVSWPSGPGPAFGGATVLAQAQHPEGSAQPPDKPSPPSTERGHQGGEHREAGHGESIWATIARLLNFAILVGVLVYFVRSPFIAYLAQRSADIRGGLTQAAAMREEATQQLEAVNRRLSALPGEIEALKAGGVQEIAAEEARIRASAEAERGRLLEQARREIELQLRVAEHELVEHAANLAVNVARDRIQRTITEQDQRRLVDRYLEQIRT